MIPRRVMLKGFLSYRDTQEFLFDGAPLWVIVGPNGAGKSAIFDSILFALYGAHRGGKENHTALINHQCDSSQVEFDFALDARVYRAKRTVSRKGKKTVGIFDLSVSPARIITDTDRESIFKRWVADEIRLDEKSFTASVLLQQGKTEALLNADPKIRHQILSQLVDISRYARLAEKVEERQKRFAGQADDHAKALDGIKPVEPGEIAAFAQILEDADAEVAHLSAALEKLAALQVQAEQWEKLRGEKENLERVLAEARKLYTRAEMIEKNATRWEELQVVLPRLTNVFDTKTRLETTRENVVSHAQEAQLAHKEFETAKGELTNARENYDVLSQQHEGARQTLETATKTLLDLGDGIRDLEELESKRKALGEVEAKLSDFPEILDGECAALQQEIDVLDELRVALPNLLTFSRKRSDWKKESAKLPLAVERQADLQNHQTVLLGEKSRLETQSEQLAATSAQWNEVWIRARTRRDDACTALERFEQIEHEAICQYCGQILKPEHLETERKRLNHTVQDAEADVDMCSQEHTAAVAGESACVDEVKRCEKESRELESKITGAQTAVSQINQNVQSAITEAKHALDLLSMETRATFPFFDGDVTLLFRQAYPTDADLGLWEARVSESGALKKQLSQLVEKLRARDRYATTRDLIAERVNTLEMNYPLERADKIRARVTKANADIASAKKTIREIEMPLGQTQAACDQWITQVESHQKVEREALGAARSEGTRIQELDRMLSADLRELLPEWYAWAEAMDQQKLDMLCDEQKGLESAISERVELEEAHQHYQYRLSRLVEIEGDLSVLPDEAKRPRDKVERESEGARQKREIAEDQRNTAMQEKQTLETQRDRRIDLEKQHAVAAKQAQLHKELARLLGREYLQRFLLQEAEKEIVKYANGVLDRISGGTMRLELRPQPIPKGKRKVTVGGTKALDLLAYNSATGSNAVSVDFLSGSQRFRAAVSLALGIGQWSQHGVRVNDAVIIDEGFGSLDKDGIRQMIEQLHNLTDVLGRIILVSHQEEFAGSFANRYLVELSDGASRASLYEGE